MAREAAPAVAPAWVAPLRGLQLAQLGHGRHLTAVQQAWARIAAAHIVPTLVAGLEETTTSAKALDALAAMAHNWQQRAHGQEMEQIQAPCCLQYETSLSEGAMKKRFQRARTHPAALLF